MSDFDIQNAKRRLSTYVNDLEATRASMVAWALDFHLDLEAPRKFKSSLIVRTNNHPSQLVLRFPDWPDDVLGKDELREIGERIMENADAPDGTEVRIERQVGGDWALHIQNHDLREVDMDEILNFIVRAQRQYANELQGGMTSSEIWDDS